MQEAGFTKADVRALALHWGLPTWDKPASPCLSSRLAPGVTLTHESTARGEAAERYAGCLQAPSKELVWFEHSAHTPHVEEPDKFRDLLMQVRAGQLTHASDRKGRGQS